MLRAKLLGLITVACALLTTVATVAPATADPVFIDGHPDKGHHTWCYMPSFNRQALADATMTRLRAQTVVGTAFHSPCGKYTDVRWSESRVPGSFGYTECKLRNTAGNCDRFRIEIDEVEMATADYVSSQRRQTFCHELGHTLGVSHYFGTNYPSGGGVSDTAHSCLRSGRVTSANQAWHTRYGPHHIAKHINPWFS